MTLTTFSDRFIYANSSLTKPIVDAYTTDQEFIDSMPNIKEYVELVQTHSVLLSRFEYKIIYNMCVNESDPRIALILAAARKLDNTALFPNMEIIKEIMFGPTSTNLTIYDRDEYNIFVDGIRRVSAAITAAKLINQLAQIPEQFKHGEALLKSALSDLDRLIKLNSISIKYVSDPNLMAWHCCCKWLSYLAASKSDCKAVERFNFLFFRSACHV
jgi:hypothetical protein